MVSFYWWSIEWLGKMGQKIWTPTFCQGSISKIPPQLASWKCLTRQTPSQNSPLEISPRKKHSTPPDQDQLKVPTKHRLTSQDGIDNNTILAEAIS